MLLLLLCIVDALAGTVTLRVGVHRDAGTVYQIAADGTRGQCSAGPGRITCPADAEITFRWGGDPSWILVGDTTVRPGDIGNAWVLASEESRAEARAEIAESAGRENVERLYVRTGINEPPAHSYGMIQDLVRLTRHPDWRVRRGALDGLVPYWRRTSSDPLPMESPEVLPSGLITWISRDRDWRVRRRLANRLRDLQSSDFAEESLMALLNLTEDPRQPVQRASMASLSFAARSDMAPAELAWDRAMRQVRLAGPPGRSGANTLGHLAKVLPPSGLVDPREAVSRTLHYHPERAWNVWNAWKEHVPFERKWTDVLLRDTVGLIRGLVRHWGETAPDEFAAALESWEPVSPHSERFDKIREYLTDNSTPSLRAVLDRDR